MHFVFSAFYSILPFCDNYVEVKIIHFVFGWPFYRYKSYQFYARRLAIMSGEFVWISL